jgi:hypothetical protein
MDEIITWKTKKGENILISQMATSHIKNVLKMLKDKGYIGVSTLSFYLTCRPPTAEYALEAFEQEFDRVIEAPTTVYIDLFEEELKKRGEESELESICS